MTDARRDNPEPTQEALLRFAAYAGIALDDTDAGAIQRQLTAWLPELRAMRPRGFQNLPPAVGFRSPRPA